MRPAIVFKRLRDIKKILLGLRRIRSVISKRALFVAVVMVVIATLMVIFLQSSSSNNKYGPSAGQLEAMLQYLTVEERDILLNSPAVDAPREDHQAYYDKLISIAQEAESVEFIDLNECLVASPAVVRAEIGDTLIFRNQGIRDRVIAHNQDYVFVIPAHGTREIIADFGTGLGGVYGYGCDNSDYSIGLLILSSDNSGENRDDEE